MKQKKPKKTNRVNRRRPGQGQVLSVYFENSLYRSIATMAAKQNRSMCGQIAHMLEFATCEISKTVVK